MKGIKRVRISNRVARFDFELKRNITIVRGDSGTGKTTLFNMVLDYTRNKEQSGVNLSAPCDCIAVYQDWKRQLVDVNNSIVFIDEDYNNNFLKTKEFAEYVQKSDNYFVLFTREDLHELPYSVEEIYSIKMSGKYHRFERMCKKVKSWEIISSPERTLTMPTIYCYRKCTTCQKAMKWLEDRGIEYTFIDIKDDHPSEEKLRDLHAKSGQNLRRFFNTSGMLYREMELAKRLPQMSEDEMFALLATDGMLVKRPILIAGDKVAVGFKEKEWEEVLGG